MYSSAPNYNVRSRSGISFRKILLLLFIVFLGAVTGLTILHMWKGAGASDAVYMMIEDVRVAATCPDNGTVVWKFMMRPDSTSMIAGKSGNLDTRIINEVCQGSLTLARVLAESSSDGSTGLTSPSVGTSDGQPPIIRPTAIAIYYTPTPRVPAPDVAPIVFLVGNTPDSTPALRNTPTANSPRVLENESGKSTESENGSFFKSVYELKKSAGITQPEIGISELEFRIHNLINVQREESNLESLAFDKDLVAIARRHSVEMASNEYLSHEDLAGRDPSERGADQGYDCIKKYSDHYTFGLAENIHQGWLFSSVTYFNGVPIRDWNSQEDIALIAVSGWMESTGHRSNILTDTYDRSGVGVAVAADGKVFITQDFC